MQQHVQMNAWTMHPLLHPQAYPLLVFASLQVLCSMQLLQCTAADEIITRNA